MGSWKITGNDFSEDELRAALDEVVDETAKAVAQDAGHGAPVQTGALSRSYYKSDPKGSDYEKAKAAMLGQNGAIKPEPEVRPDDWRDADVHNAIVDSAAPYAEHIEYGHVAVFTGVGPSRFTAGRAPLGNAMRGQEDRFKARLAAALRHLKAKNVTKA